MSRPQTATLLLAALTAGSLLTAALPALAQNDSMAEREALYSAYYRAVAAHERCRKTKLPEEAHAAIARYAERQGASKIGTKRLTLIQEAKQDIRAAGCDSPLAAEALARFDSELAPQIP